MWSPGINDLRYNDLLTELRLNPKWEKWRANLLTASFICALFPIYMTLGGATLDCVPFNSNTSEVMPFTAEEFQLSEAQTQFVNELCDIQDSGSTVTGCGISMLLIGCFILLYSSQWLHLEAVSVPVRKFVKCRDEFLERKPSENHEPHLTALENILKLKTIDRVFIQYRRRCICLIILLISDIGISIFQLTYIYLIADPTPCDLDKVTSSKGKSEMPMQSFTCMIRQKHTIILFLGAFISLLLHQLYLITVGLMVTSKTVKHLPPAEKSMMMMALFAHNCTSVDSESFVMFVKRFVDTRANRNIRNPA